MRLGPIASLLAFGSLATAWHVTLYSGETCNDGDDGEFQYFSIDGEGSMSFCDAPTSTMHGVTSCAFFAKSGHDGPHDCDRQFSPFKSVRVLRGELEVWSGYDDHPDQPDNARCSGAAQSGGKNRVFTHDSGCVKLTDYFQGGGRGILAREGDAVCCD